MDKLVTDFGHKYADYIYNAAEYPIQAIKWQDLKKECSKNTTSAGGMDGWTKADLAWASDYAFQWLAAWYTSIEASRKWPTELTKARTVFLAKDSNDTGNPMAYRILKITSTLYRLWASVRIQDLEGWIQTWADPAMFAGIPGAGAEEAWYLTQLDFELKRLTNSHIAAGSIDVYKCIDQIVRPLAIDLARKAGMPTSILDTYSAFKHNYSCTIKSAQH